MKVERIRPADAVVGFWGLVLLAGLFLDWYTRPEGGVSGWGAFGVLDKLLALLAIVAIATPVVTAACRTPAWPVALNVITLALSFVVAFFYLYRLFDQPGLDRDVVVDAGAWIGGFALLGVFIASAFAQRDERAPGIDQPPEIQVMPMPPAGVPGSSPTQEPA